MTPTRPVWAEISRSRLFSNWKLLQHASPDADLLAVVKANAYGHGALLCGPVLAAAGASWLGVTCVEEGIALRKACADTYPGPRILVMSGLWEGEAEAMLAHQLTPQVWAPFHFDLLEQAAAARGLAPQSVAVHLEIDTGMSRQGVRTLDELKSLLARCHSRSPLRIEGVLTHFHSPEVLDPDQTGKQIERFAAVLAIIAEHGIQPAWIHAGNSATLFDPHHTDAIIHLAKRFRARPMLRPGLALYGYAARFTPGDRTVASQEALQPVLSWKTRITSLREIDAGDSAGYNGTFTATRTTKLALLPVGYADGLNRLLSNRGHAIVRGFKAPIAGRISMDQTILDVTDIADTQAGDEVILIGEEGSQRITACDLADATGTIPYEVLCAIGARVPRVIVD